MWISMDFLAWHDSKYTAYFWKRAWRRREGGGGKFRSKNGPSRVTRIYERYRLSHKRAQTCDLCTSNFTAKSTRVRTGSRVGGVAYRAEFISDVRLGHPPTNCRHPPPQSEHCRIFFNKKWPRNRCNMGYTVIKKETKDGGGTGSGWSKLTLETNRPRKIVPPSQRGNYSNVVPEVTCAHISYLYAFTAQHAFLVRWACVFALCIQSRANEARAQRRSGLGMSFCSRWLGNISASNGSVLLQAGLDDPQKSTKTAAQEESLTSPNSVFDGTGGPR